jgi:D-alanine-D-alanine ligase
VGKIRVAVVMGGENSEREVSLASGREVMRNLNRDRYEVVGVEVPSELGKLKVGGVDLAFLALHGKGGEDGRIQGYLDTLGIKYTGSEVEASVLGMNKKIFRRLAEKEGVLMPPEVGVVPCVVKPANGGSSVGVSIVKKKGELRKAMELARSYGGGVIVEKYIEGVEVSCGVLGNETPVALPVIEIRPKKKFFDYEAKYTIGMSEEICPAEIGDKLTKKVQKIAVRVFGIIGARGLARVDMIIEGEKVYVLEVNTLPGMTPNSLLPKEAMVAGMNYSQLLDKIIELGME